MSDAGAFFTGFLVGIICMLVILAFGMDVRHPDRIISDKYLDNNNIRYNVTIDSIVTDSLFGKTWRK